MLCTFQQNDDSPKGQALLPMSHGQKRSAEIASGMLGSESALVGVKKREGLGYDAEMKGGHELERDGGLASKVFVHPSHAYMHIGTISVMTFSMEAFACVQWCSHIHRRWSVRSGMIAARDNMC